MNIIVKRKLNNFESWKKIVTQADGSRKKYVSKGAMGYRSARDPNEVYLIFDWDDQKSFMEYMNLPDVKEVLAQSGTLDVIEIGESFFLEE